VAHGCAAVFGECSPQAKPAVGGALGDVLTVGELLRPGRLDFARRRLKIGSGDAAAPWRRPDARRDRTPTGGAAGVTTSASGTGWREPHGRWVMSGGQVSVAVVGAGDLGRGWAALCAAQGWPVALYDLDAGIAERARAEAAARAQALLALVGADAALVDRGVCQLRLGRSLLQACGDAEWVIEAIPDDLIAKQKLFEGLEAAAPKARVITSSSSTLHPEDLAARCRRPDRLLVAHPMNPPELIPLVELLPGPHTDRALVELVKGWLRAMGRIPVTLKKPVRGNVAGRIAAAVWREAIQLVLDGAIDVDDLDRAVSVGPALGWVAAGPHLSHHLAAGGRDIPRHLQLVLRKFEDIWGDLARWDKLAPEDQHHFIGAIQRAYQDQADHIKVARDRRLAAILQALEMVRQA
jgi:carnitine 3-dehydrogenase